MAEYTCIFFVSGRIGRYFAILDNIFGKCRIVKYNPVLAIEAFFYRIKRFGTKPFFFTYACHGAPSLRFDKYFRFFVFITTYFLAIIIVSPDKPFAIPSMFFNGINHIINLLLGADSFVIFTQLFAEVNIVAAIKYK